MVKELKEVQENHIKVEELKVKDKMKEEELIEEKITKFYEIISKSDDLKDNLN